MPKMSKEHHEAKIKLEQAAYNYSMYILLQHTNDEEAADVAAAAASENAPQMVMDKAVAYWAEHIRKKFERENPAGAAERRSRSKIFEEDN